MAGRPIQHLLRSAKGKLIISSTEMSQNNYFLHSSRKKKNKHKKCTLPKEDRPGNKKAPQEQVKSYDPHSSVEANEWWDQAANSSGEKTRCKVPANSSYANNVSCYNKYITELLQRSCI